MYHFSATDAGVRLLPLVFVQNFFLVISGRFLIPRIRRYKWIVVASPVLLTIGSGLLYSVKYGTPIASIYGFQVILGAGVGLGLQNAMLAVQVDLREKPHWISAGMGLTTFLGFMGRIIGISLASSVFQNMITRNLHKHAPELPEPLVQAATNDATAIWTVIPEQFRASALIGYSETLRLVFLIGVPMGFLCLVAALFIKDDKMPSKEEEMAKNQALKEKEAREDQERAKAKGDEAPQEVVELEKGQ